MKPLFSLFAFTLISSVIIFPVSPALAYDLYCRGPFEIRSDATKELGLGYGPVIVINKGTKGVAPDGKGLSEGTCSWGDRGLNADEPRFFVINAPMGEGAHNEPYPVSLGVSLLSQFISHRTNVLSKIDFLTRSDYVVVMDAVQAANPVRQPYLSAGNEAPLRLIPVRKPVEKP